jgi:hypothetical protein
VDNCNKLLNTCRKYKPINLKSQEMRSKLRKYNKRAQVYLLIKNRQRTAQIKDKEKELTGIYNF